MSGTELTVKPETATLESQESKAIIAMGASGLKLNSLEDIYRFAKLVVAAEFAPKGMNQSACAAAIVMGQEIGLAPMQAIQNIAVINGRPSVWGDAAKALVEGSGLCTEFDEAFTGRPYDDEFGAICTVRRAGRLNSVVGRFDVGDAKLAGLWKKSGPWTQYPKRMLQMRARAFALRDAFPDVLKGTAIAEEARDYIDVTPSDPKPTNIESLIEQLEAAPPAPETVGDFSTALEVAAQESAPPAPIEAESEETTAEESLETLFPEPPPPRGHDIEPPRKARR